MPTQKTAIIIGASSGIGRSLVLQLVEKGYRVGIGARRMHLLKDIRKRAPQQIIIRQVNVTFRETAIKRIYEMIHELQGVDIFIYSSATGYINHKLNWNIIRKTDRTNVEAFSGIVTAIYKYFKKKGEGHIVVISSVAGLKGNRHAPSYSASKAYQIAFMQGLRQKACHEKSSIYLTDIRPGFVDTNMAGSEKVFWMASPEKAARQIYSAIAKKKKIVYITKRWKIVALLFRLLPDYLYNRI